MKMDLNRARKTTRHKNHPMEERKIKNNQYVTRLVVGPIYGDAIVPFHIVPFESNDEGVIIKLKDTKYLENAK